jgi:hypothetical protein
MASRENLPRSMRYALTSVPAIEADSTLARFDSTNGVSFSPTGANEIRIRVKGNGFLNGAKHYLYFKVTTATANCHIDGDAGSFFDRMTIEANGTQVEQIDRYALWNGIRRNYNADVYEINKKSVESGGGQLASIATTTAGGVDKVALSNLGEAITAGENKIYCIQLQSGLLMGGSHAKALPDGLSELEIVLRLKGSAGALVSAGAPTYTISDPRIYCPVYRILNGDVMSSYNQLASSGISWAGDTVKTYVNSVITGAGQKVLQLNDRSMSLKAIITALRDDTVDTTNASYSNTSFLLQNGTGAVTDYVVKIAGQNYPQSQIQIQTATNGLNIGRCYEEAIKSLAKHGEKYANSQVDRHQFKSSEVTYTSATDNNAITAGKGLLCVDLRKFDDADLRMVGLNTASNASPSILELTVTNMGTNLDATSFALVEAIWTMDNTGALRVAM